MYKIVDLKVPLWVTASERTGMKHVVRGICLLLVAFYLREASTFSFDNSTGSFVERCQADCNLHKDFVTCGKYRMIRWLDNIKEQEFGYGPLRLVRIPSMPLQRVLPVLPRSRIFKSNILDTMNFLRNTAEDFLTKRVLVYTIENPSGARALGSGPMVLDDIEFEDMKKRQESAGDWRIFKKKKSLILPLLILLNLIKVKLLLLPIVVGIHFIKKFLVLGGLFVPSILAHLKACTAQAFAQQNHPLHIWAGPAEPSSDYPTGYDQEEVNWLHRHDYPGHFAYPGYQRIRNPYG